MKRPIEFRVWNPKLRVMGYTTSSLFVSSDYAGAYIGAGMDHNYPGNDNQEDIIMQYVGLEDKNGKKIFEDDIVLVEEHYLGDIRAPRQLATIEFSEAEFYLENLENESKWLESNISSHTLNGRLTIVGNKHESNINQLKNRENLL